VRLPVSIGEHVMKKLLVCDVEGTIFKAEYKIDGTDYVSTMWQPLARSLGEAAIEEEVTTHKKWDNKDYKNYTEWVEATIRIHKKYGLHRDVFHALINEAKYNEGVVEFFTKLDRNHYIPVLVSGGFEELIGRAMRELGIFYGYGACEYFFDENDGKLSGHRLKNCDFEDKFDHIESILKRFQLNAKTDRIFVGDGKNDVHIAKKAPISFGINANPQLAKIVHHQIKSFTEIMPYLDNAPIRISPLTKDEELVFENKMLSKENKELRDKLNKLDTSSSVRENRLSKEVNDLRELNKKFKQQINKMKGISDEKSLRINNHIMVKQNDYKIQPIIELVAILDSGYKIALFGFNEHHKVYKYFKKYHKY
jgi:phosphoserine phosphatase